MKEKLLTKKEIEKLQREYSDWTLQKKDTVLCKTFATKNFVDGLVFLARITIHAEILNHHPDVEIRYNQVKVKTTTHSIGGLTKKDTELIARIEKSAQAK